MRHKQQHQRCKGRYPAYQISKLKHAARTLTGRVTSAGRNILNVGLLHQVDTYYATKHGRLKLREINGEQAQLIPYQDYQTGPMRSQFSVFKSELSIVKPLLEQLLGVIGVIDKQRECFVG